MGKAHVPDKNSAGYKLGKCICEKARALGLLTRCETLLEDFVHKMGSEDYPCLNEVAMEHLESADDLLKLIKDTKDDD